MRWRGGLPQCTTCHLPRCRRLPQLPLDLRHRMAAALSSGGSGWRQPWAAAPLRRQVDFCGKSETRGQIYHIASSHEAKDILHRVVLIGVNRLMTCCQCLLPLLAGVLGRQRAAAGAAAQPAAPQVAAAGRPAGGRARRRLAQHAQRLQRRPCGAQLQTAVLHTAWTLLTMLFRGRFVERIIMDCGLQCSSHPVLTAE